jgi:cell division protein FtsZ
MIATNSSYLNFVAVDTDENSLANSKAPVNIKIDERDPQEIQNEILKMIEGSDIVFVVAGIGGNTGTKLASIITAYAKGMNALTLAVVTFPSAFENLKEKAAEGINKLRKCADSFIVVDVDKLSTVADGKVFKTANEFLNKIIHGATDLLTTPGLVNLDFVDLKKIITDSGMSFVGIGEATGENSAFKAAKNALNSPLINPDIKKAHFMLMNFSGLSENLSMTEINEAMMTVQATANKDAEIIWGISESENLGDTVRVTVFASRFYS